MENYYEHVRNKLFSNNQQLGHHYTQQLSNVLIDNQNPQPINYNNYNNYNNNNQLNSKLSLESLYTSQSSNQSSSKNFSSPPSSPTILNDFNQFFNNNNHNNNNRKIVLVLVQWLGSSLGSFQVNDINDLLSLKGVGDHHSTIAYLPIYCDVPIKTTPQNLKLPGIGSKAHQTSPLLIRHLAQIGRNDITIDYFWKVTFVSF